MVRLAAAAVSIVAGSLGIWTLMQARQHVTAARAVRAALHAELQPVTLSTCTLQRYGGANDGGYLLCGHLIDECVGATATPASGSC